MGKPPEDLKGCFHWRNPLPELRFSWRSPRCQRVSPKQSQRFRPNSNEEQVLQKAREHFEATLIGVQGELAGSVAAMEHRRADDALNYGEIFLRDNVPVMIYLMLEGRFAIVKQFLRVSLQLQSTNVQTRGVFPTSFVEEEGELVADYGQRSIGRITSVDASLWWPILCWIYVKRSGDIDSAEVREVQRGLTTAARSGSFIPASRAHRCCSFPIARS